MMVIGNLTLDAFKMAYVEAALWSSTDDKGVPLDKDHGPHEIAPETLAQMCEDCRQFQEAYGTLIADNIVCAGHDFWLTRQRHGAGYWDGDWPEEIGKKLTEAAHAFGEFDLYVGDDGLIYH